MSDFDESQATSAPQSARGHQQLATPSQAASEAQGTLSHPALEARQVGHLDLSNVTDRLVALQPLLRLKGAARHEAVRLVAAEHGKTKATVYRWLKGLKQEGVTALASKPRADQGRVRLPDETYDLIVNGLLSNSVHTSVQQVHRALLLAVPDAMHHEHGLRRVPVSEQTVRRIKKALEADPFTRVLFYDDTQRKEYLRTYNGSVVALCANDLWQMDMTYCDIEVLDEQSGDFFRPRIHAVIDVFSGCIVGLEFSEIETQEPTDEALRRAFTPKQGPHAAKYPIFGVPARMYWDNGKVYRSEHAERMMRELGVVSIHSQARVSHTRGKIERFFGTLHRFERTLPGYVGENAVDRDSEGLKHLRGRTMKWRENGIEPEGGRHLTFTEYRNRIVAWLLAGYHQEVVDGKRRVDWFTDHVRPGSQPLLSPEQLYLLTSRRVERVVTPDGGVQLEGTLYKVPNGVLAAYRGMKVLVFPGDALTGAPTLVYHREHNGKLTLLGEASPAPTDALSIESGELRRAQRGVLRAVDAAAKETRQRRANPDLTLARQHELEMGTLIEALPAPQPTPHITAVDGAKRVTVPDDMADFHAAFEAPLSTDLAGLLSDLED